MKVAEAAALANAARTLLNQGDAEGAERVLYPILGNLWSDPATLHLMGLIKKAQNQLAEAERYFRKAITLSLSEGGYYNDLGVVLQQQGQYAEAIRVLRAAMVLSPDVMAVRANLVRALMAANDLTEAEREARGYVAAEPSAESWTLLSQVQRAQDRNDDALVSAKAALDCAPKLRGLRYNYALALERVGRGGEALEYYERLAKQELDSADLAHNYARALYAAGRKQDAEAIAEQAAQIWPGSTMLHSTLARMRWLRGEGAKCVAVAEAELLWRRPTDMALRLACVDALHRGGHLQEALKALEEALRLAPDSPPLLSARGIILDELDRSLDALKDLRRAAELMPGRAGQRNMLSTLLRARQPQEALELSRALQVKEPDEQYLIACEAIALRMLEDPGYGRLCDFDRMVRIYDIGAPSGYFTAESFNVALADMLRAYHRAHAHPLDQTAPNMSQTGRSLLAAPDPLTKTFIAAVDVAVRECIRRLPEGGDDPVTRRRTKHYRYANMWSVRLTKGGHQPNHVHDRGWISGVYVVALTPEERPKNPQAGWLKLGEPNRPPAGCGPERVIEPKVGQLVLFPSYFWHGVFPMEGSDRVTIGFTVTPS
jgi:Flp pilus assembly protein TadD